MCSPGFSIAGTSQLLISGLPAQLHHVAGRRTGPGSLLEEEPALRQAGRRAFATPRLAVLEILPTAPAGGRQGGVSRAANSTSSVHFQFPVLEDAGLGDIISFSCAFSIVLCFNWLNLLPFFLLKVPQTQLIPLHQAAYEGEPWEEPPQTRSQEQKAR